jgi:hypothetical protein
MEAKAMKYLSTPYPSKAPTNIERAVAAQAPRSNPVIRGMQFLWAKACDAIDETAKRDFDLDEWRKLEFRNEYREQDGERRLR